MILDGYGLNDKTEGNAIAQAKTPVMDELMAKTTRLYGEMRADWQSVCRTDRWEILRSDI